MTFRPAREGYLGLTYPAQSRIDIYVRACPVEPPELLRHVVAHELGHARDAASMTGAMRDAWKRARGIERATPWFGCSGCADFATPAGDFAEVYAQWAEGATSNFSRLASAPDAATLSRLARQFFGA